MTFTDSPQQLWNAIQADLKAREAAIATYEQLAKAYEGGDGAPSNHCYEYATLVGPQIIFRNPRVSVTSRVPGIMSSMRIGMRYALETEQQRQRVAEIWEHVITESFFIQGITHVSGGGCALGECVVGQPSASSSYSGTRSSSIFITSCCLPPSQKLQLVSTRS